MLRFVPDLSATGTGGGDRGKRSQGYWDAVKRGDSEMIAKIAAHIASRQHQNGIRGVLGEDAALVPMPRSVPFSMPRSVPFSAPIDITTGATMLGAISAVFDSIPDLPPEGFAFFRTQSAGELGSIWSPVRSHIRLLGNGRTQRTP